MTRDPIVRFEELFAAARAAGEAQGATAMTLATVDASGAPTARMVLLKSVDASGFTFYTNYESRKAEHLELNGNAALVFYWSLIDTQVRVEGSVTRTTDAEADEYFASRPRQSQLGAWASKQSETLESRRDLLQSYLAEKARWRGQAVERPPHWGGYRVRPARIEFWESRLGRLHDRTVYERTGDGDWATRMLNP